LGREISWNIDEAGIQQKIIKLAEKIPEDMIGKGCKILDPTNNKYVLIVTGSNGYIVTVYPWSP
jgi:hypothetical protein